ncbi:ATP-binding protein [Streptomyces sp. HNM0663]|uniref:ATP-binding protein n=1 Tax=Streptomyces chengmaiensis TaxID=3040919 RepID=A0ABT6HZ34_9ACTN|nr:ATP-binding protein [Streptomyces chengmaiensis]MDH2393587.1 ATP-binding protein [Streptomyces chengmaiensis]
MQVLQVQLEVGPDPAEVGRARRWARSRLAGSGIGEDEPLAQTLILLISELVTNAVVHTGCPAVLRMLFGGCAAGAGTGRAGSGAGTVRVEVSDASARPPLPRHADGEDTSGRGLELVDGLADRWGWRLESVGKSIWCEVDRTAPAVPSAPEAPAVSSATSVSPLSAASPVPPVSSASAIRPEVGPGAETSDAVGARGARGMEAYAPSRAVTHRS